MLKNEIDGIFLPLINGYGRICGMKKKKKKKKSEIWTKNHNESDESNGGQPKVMSGVHGDGEWRRESEMYQEMESIENGERQEWRTPRIERIKRWRTLRMENAYNGEHQDWRAPRDVVH